MHLIKHFIGITFYQCPCIHCQPCSIPSALLGVLYHYMQSVKLRYKQPVLPWLIVKPSSFKLSSLGIWKLKAQSDCTLNQTELIHGPFLIWMKQLQNIFWCLKHRSNMLPVYLVHIPCLSTDYRLVFHWFCQQCWEHTFLSVCLSYKSESSHNQNLCLRNQLLTSKVLLVH